MSIDVCTHAYIFAYIYVDIYVPIHTNIDMYYVFTYDYVQREANATWTPMGKRSTKSDAEAPNISKHVYMYSVYICAYIYIQKCASIYICAHICFQFVYVLQRRI